MVKRPAKDDDFTVEHLRERIRVTKANKKSREEYLHKILSWKKKSKTPKKFDEEIRATRNGIAALDNELEYTQEELQEELTKTA